MLRKHGIIWRSSKTFGHIRDSEGPCRLQVPPPEPHCSNAPSKKASSCAMASRYSAATSPYSSASQHTAGPAAARVPASSSPAPNAEAAPRVVFEAEPPVASSFVARHSIRWSLSHASRSPSNVAVQHSNSGDPYSSTHLPYRRDDTAVFPTSSEDGHLVPPQSSVAPSVASFAVRASVCPRNAYRRMHGAVAAQSLSAFAAADVGVARGALASLSRKLQ
mmetsp:Transcript_59062/g.118576  ORF Transcript_59062/g.118576 Transcript_59062/m.118576 type:complete len:220 (+) Transcript_59062:268-927(+)